MTNTAYVNVTIHEAKTHLSRLIQKAIHGEEIVISKGKLHLGNHWEEKLEEERRANRFHWLDLAPRHYEAIITLPRHHKDPFDRMLIAQAQCENLKILSCDQKLSLYTEGIVW